MVLNAESDLQSVSNGKPGHVQIVARQKRFVCDVVRLELDPGIGALVAVNVIGSDWASSIILRSFPFNRDVRGASESHLERIYHSRGRASLQKCDV